MHFTLKQIATIRSPFCDLVNMPVQSKGARDTYATIEFDKVETEARSGWMQASLDEVTKKKSDDRFVQS